MLNHRMPDPVQVTEYKPSLDHNPSRGILTTSGASRYRWINMRNSGPSMEQSPSHRPSEREIVSFYGFADSEGYQPDLYLRIACQSARNGV